tara:strand:- start:622 stop:1161 length:540 start_codon:yes stop_codon:yes gene_type:complete
MVIWILGKSGSGKTSLAKYMLRFKLKTLKWVHIDGDIIRKIFNDNSDFSSINRLNNAQRISKIVKLLDEQNINVIVSSLTNFKYWLKWNRKNFKNYFEIYLRVNMKTLLKRDKKNLYISALKKKIKNVVGVDIKFNKPDNPDLILDNNKKLKNFEVLSKKIFSNQKFKKILKNEEIKSI